MKIVLFLLALSSCHCEWSAKRQEMIKGDPLVVEVDKPSKPDAGVVKDVPFLDPH